MGDAGPSSKKLGALVAEGGTAGADEVTFAIKWSGKEYTVVMDGGASVADLKERISLQTNVLAKRQKLLGLKTAAGKLADDGSRIADLVVKPGTKIMMMGTAEKEMLVEPLEGPDIVDDFEIAAEEERAIQHRDENLMKLRRRIEQYKLVVRNPPRPGKKLLVLDIDYTLFDHRSVAETPLELQRPYLHEFLAAAYSEYDIIIWSATGMKWVEVKMKELGVLSNPSYKITALMDHGAMITISSGKRVFDCKPLGVIWGKFPENYSEKNTIMFDDIRHNHVMNPQNGLVIRPFRKAHFSRATDQELLHLTDYLLAIAELEDLTSLDHEQWEAYVRLQRRRRA